MFLFIQAPWLLLKPENTEVIASVSKFVIMYILFILLYSTFVIEICTLQVSPHHFLFAACLSVSYRSDSPEQIESWTLWPILQSDIDHAESPGQLASQR